MTQEKVHEKIIPQHIPTGEINPKSTFILGLDVARQGLDQTAFVVLEQPPFDKNIFVVYVEALHTPDLKQVIGKTVYLDKFFNFKRVIVDETGMGSGVTDILKGQLKGRVEGIWYTSKKKAEIFSNLRILMSRPNDKLYFPDYNTCDPHSAAIVKKMYFQFLTILSEYSDSTGLKTPKIYHEKGKNDDIINALCLASMYFDVSGKKNKRPVIGCFKYTS